MGRNELRIGDHVFSEIVGCAFWRFQKWVEFQPTTQSVVGKLFTTMNLATDSHIDLLRPAFHSRLYLPDYHYD